MNIYIEMLTCRYIVVTIHDTLIPVIRNNICYLAANSIMLTTTICSVTPVAYKCILPPLEANNAMQLLSNYDIIDENTIRKR